MDKSELLLRLQDIEWDDFEVKDASKGLPKNIWETVCAFANTAGGWIVLGVAKQGNKFEITGLVNAEKIEQDFINTIRSQNKFNVIITPKCKKYGIARKTVLAFYIPSSEKKPVYFNSLQNTFIRTASGDSRASEYEINALYREQSFGTMSGKIVVGTTIKSINRNSFKNFRDYLKRMVPSFRYNPLSDKDFCQKLQITKNGKLTYGGLLFLGKNSAIQNEFPDFRIDYLEIPGLTYSDSELRYTFRLQEQENLWEYYFALFQRLQIYADNPLSIDKMGNGTEDNKQLEALREALVNILIHSDYFSPMKPRIRVFTDRIEFENPGSLPRPIDELLKISISVPRNPALAKLFRCAKFCENVGYGFDKMKAWDKENQSQSVSFESSIDRTKIIFTLGEKLPENYQKTTRKLPENYQKTTRKLPENNVEEKILDMLKDNSRTSRSELSEQLQISRDLAKYYLDKLKKKGIIRHKGSDKGGEWEIC